MKNRTTKKTLRANDWDFSTVEPDALAAVAWYEFARDAYGDFRKKFQRGIRTGELVCYRDTPIHRLFPAASYSFLSAKDTPLDIAAALRFYALASSFSARAVTFGAAPDEVMMSAPAHMAHIALNFDLRFTDNQLAEALIERIAELRADRNRPSPKHGFYPVGAGGFAFPVKPASALEYLSIFRQRRAGIAIDEIRMVGSSEPREVLRREKWAKSIIEFMRTGDASKLDALPAKKAHRRRLKK